MTISSSRRRQLITRRGSGGGTIFNVKTGYGAVGDGVTDDSAAILAAVNAAASFSPLGDLHGVVYFPAGLYRITQSGVVTATTTKQGLGLLYIGDGRFTSRLQLDTSGASSDKWFYDPVSQARMLGPSFVDLGFEVTNVSAIVTYSDISDYAKGFRIWSTFATGSHEQNFRFTRCKFTCLNVVISLEGDNTASENSFAQCDFIFIKNTVLRIDNQQAFNNTFHGCNFTEINGHTFDLVSGGGAIQVYGGSVILESAATDTYFFNVVGNAGGFGSFPILFSGLRIELRGNKTKLHKSPATIVMDVRYENCQFHEQGTVDKTNWCTVSSYGSVEFRACTFYEYGGARMKFVIDGAWGYGQSGQIIFQSCIIPDDWSDRCSLTNDTGRITARDCFGFNVGAAFSVANAYDFDARGDQTVGLYTAWGAASGGGSANDNNVRLKTAYVLLPATGWPYTGWEPTLKLPRNAIIKNIHLRKPASGADTTVCTIKINRNDKTGTAHLTSDSQQYKVAQTGDVANYFYNVGSTTNERTLKIYASVAIGVSSYTGGFAIVEYY